MLTAKEEWVDIVEVNPPHYPDMSHVLLLDRWQAALVTDNPFREIRVSPYAYAARLTHDVPSVHPTVVVSTRDRNILSIESEVRGAIGNGVDSFLVVTGDSLPAVDHLAHHLEIVAHLKELQEVVPPFEVGMLTRFQEWVMRRRIDAGAEFFVAGPVLDPATVGPNLARLKVRDDDPPIFLGVVPPFSPSWVERMEGLGTVPVTDDFRSRLAATPKEKRRTFGWTTAKEAADAARQEGAAGVVLMGLKFDTVIGEAHTEWGGGRGNRPA